MNSASNWEATAATARHASFFRNARTASCWSFFGANDVVNSRSSAEHPDAQSLNVALPLNSALPPSSSATHSKSEQEKSNRNLTFHWNTTTCASPLTRLRSQNRRCRSESTFVVASLSSSAK